HHMAQALDAVALHQAHGAGVIERPNGLEAMALRGAGERFGHFVQRRVPAYWLELAARLRSRAPQRLREPVRVMHALGITRYFLADYARGVGVSRGAAHLADAQGVEPLHFRRA